jgi:excisionase family DNA binding protein
MGDDAEAIRVLATPAREFPDEPDLSPREAAALAGCSYWTVLEEIKRGNLRAYRRPGDRLAIRREDFCGWAYAAPVVPRERDQPVDTAPRRRRRLRATGNASALRELEQSRGVA